eukprot:7708171-Pyramimonas_sp.AAC.1
MQAECKGAPTYGSPQHKLREWNEIAQADGGDAIPHADVTTQKQDEPQPVQDTEHAAQEENGTPATQGTSIYI